MKIKDIEPVGQRVLIRFIERENKTKGGIILTDETKGRPQVAEVLAIGTLETNKVSVGDTIFSSKFAGSEFDVEGSKVHIIHEKDVIGVVKTKKEH